MSCLSIYVIGFVILMLTFSILNVKYKFISGKYDEDAIESLMVILAMVLWPIVLLMAILFVAVIVVLSYCIFPSKK